MNYIIAGTSRCGKTMLVNKVVKELNGFSKLSIDNIIDTFEKIIPQVNINFKNGIGNKELLPNFVDYFLKGAMYKDNDIGLFYILEGDGISFEKLLELNNDKDIELIMLGKASISEQEYFEEIRYYEGKYLYSEWTQRLEDKELKQKCKEWILRSKEYEKLCNENNVKFFDTSYSQVKTVNEIFEYIKKEQMNER